MSTERPLPTEQQVATVYRQLADDYSAERAAVNRERTWQRIDLKRALQRKGNLQTPSMVAPRARARLYGYAIAAVALSALCVAFLWPTSELQFAVRGGPVSTGNLGHGWVVTAAETAMLDFSDGSELQLSPETALNVNALGPRSALTRLARGAVRVDVEHHEDTRWTFLAGPYEVRVEGTQFDLSWKAERLELTMQEGRVRVVGPDQRQWVLERGDSLVLPAPTSVAANESAASRSATETPAESLRDGAKLEGGAPGLVDDGLPEAPSEAESPAAVDPTTARAGAKVAAGKRSGSLDWGRLLRDGRFGEIVSDARSLGIERTLTSGPVTDLAALAQAARYTGEGGLAEDCWKAIRLRAPGSASARQSAFFLGRVMEQQGRRADAIHWFQRYREESPGGVYAGQALGRQLVLTSGHGRTAAAQKLAEAYLERFPSGPYAKAARGILGVEAPASGAAHAGDAVSGE